MMKSSNILVAGLATVLFSTPGFAQTSTTTTGSAGSGTSATISTGSDTGNTTGSTLGTPSQTSGSVTGTMNTATDSTLTPNGAATTGQRDAAPARSTMSANQLRDYCSQSVNKNDQQCFQYRSETATSKARSATGTSAR